MNILSSIFVIKITTNSCTLKNSRRDDFSKQLVNISHTFRQNKSDLYNYYTRGFMF